MKAFSFFSGAILSGLLLAGCAGVAHVEKDKTVNFSNYHSYAWAETHDQQDSTKTKISDLSERKIHEVVDAEMAKAGWKQVKHRPDILLSYDVLVERNVKEDRNPVYSEPMTRYVYNPYARRWVAIYYPSEFMGYENNQRSVKEGTLTLSMIDTKTDKTVWQGWTTGEVNSRNLTNKEIQNSVKNIFRKFDVAKN